MHNDSSDIDLVEAARSFHRDGFLVLRGAFRGDRLVELRDHALALKDRVQADPVEGMRYWYGGSVKREKIPSAADAARYSWGINEITRPGLFDPMLIDAIGTEPLLAVLETVLEAPRAWGQKLLWAPKTTHYDLHWHRDTDHRFDALMPYKPAANDHVQFNGALEPDDSFMVVPGSHRRAITDRERGILHGDNRGELPGQIRVSLEPGDVVLMDAHAVHRGSCPPGSPRLSLHYSFQAQWVPLKPWGCHDWHCSEEFIGSLDPRVRPCYDRLRTAERIAADADSNLSWLLPHAERKGWRGELVSPWPAGRKRAY